jgi:tetratricopeptide (TPR) repeat protein
MVYLFKGQLTQAKELIDRFDYTVESYRPKILKGFYKALNNDIEGALKDYNEVIAETKGMDSVVVLTLMGDAYRRKGSWDGAIQQYEKAISLDPGFSSAYYGMGVAFMGKRDVARAYELFSKTLSIDPDNVLALADMADMTLIRKSKPEDALVFAQRAVAKSPPFSQPYLAMGNVLVVLGREKEADDYYRKAIDHGVAAYMVPYSRARAYYLKGDREKTRYYLSELGRYKDLPEKMRDLVRQNGE